MVPNFYLCAIEMAKLNSYKKDNFCFIQSNFLLLKSFSLPPPMSVLFLIFPPPCSHFPAPHFLLLNSSYFSFLPPPHFPPPPYFPSLPPLLPFPLTKFPPNFLHLFLPLISFVISFYSSIFSSFPPPPPHFPPPFFSHPPSLLYFLLLFLTFLVIPLPSYHFSPHFLLLPSSYSFSPFLPHPYFPS